MKPMIFLGIVASCFVLAAQAGAQQQDSTPVETAAPSISADPAAEAALSPVPLEWTPPALDELNRLAAMKSSFTLDRNLLDAAAGMLPDSEAGDRQVIRKLDGISVHSLRFGDPGIPDERAVASIRAAYHLRGWKHLVTTSRSGGPMHSQNTDLWVVMDGINVRGAVVLAETPRSLTLVTVAGNLSPVDLLHLRGHFGIPRFDDDSLKNPQ